jgi:hypothetical protein
MSLASAIGKKTAGNSSSHGPKYYNAQKKAFIEEMAMSPETVTRIQVAASDYVPSRTLATMLDNELDHDVLHTILLNSRTPLKAIERFAETARAANFNDDIEVAEFIRSRSGVKDGASENTDKENLDGLEAENEIEKDNENVEE